MRSRTLGVARPRIRRVTWIAVTALTVLPLLSCGSDAPASGAPGAAQPASGETALAGDNGAGEGTPIRFVSHRYHYRVDFPAPMSEASDGTASGTRGTEQLSIRVVTGSQAADTAAYARSDAANIRARSPGYREVSQLGQVVIGGRTMAKLVFSWSGGTSAVTGNPQPLVTAVYYIPRDATTLAVLTYSIAPGLYDPQGADDTAATFVWQ